MAKRPIRRTSGTRKRKPKRKTSPSSSEGFYGFRPISLVVFGPEKVGKTEFAAHFPNTAFLIDPQETGVYDLLEFGTTPTPEHIETASTFEQGKDFCYQLAAGDFPNVKTLCVDSLTGFEKLCFKHHCEEHFDGDWSTEGFYAFHKGPRQAAKTDWPDLLDAFIDVLNAGISVVLIAHAQVKDYNNPEGPNYDRFTPYLDKEIWQATHRWAKAIFFYNYYVSVEEKKVGKNKAISDTESRFLYTERSSAFDAGHRFGPNFPPLIDAGDSGKEAFDNFLEAMEGTRKS